MTRSILTAAIAVVAASAAVLVAFDDASARGFRGGFSRAMSHRAAMPRMNRAAAPRMGGRAAPRVNRLAQPRTNRMAQTGASRFGQPQVNRLGQPRVNRLGRPGAARGRRNAPATQGGLPKVNLAQFDRTRGAAQGPANNGRRYGQMAPAKPQTPAATPATPANGNNGVKQRARQKVITLRDRGWRLDARLRAAWEFDSRVRLGERATPPLTPSELKRIDDAGGTTEMVWLNKKEMEEVINREIEENNEALRQALDESRQADAWRE